MQPKLMELKTLLITLINIKSNQYYNNELVVSKILSPQI
jgi:hypothetical protein